MNKKGVTMAINTIVTIIIVLIVLVVVIYGFTVGWGNLFKNITGYGGGSVNAQIEINGCGVACSVGSDASNFDYCSRIRNIVFVEGAKSVPVTCLRLEEPPYTELPRCEQIDFAICKTKSDSRLGIISPVDATKPALP